MTGDSVAAGWKGVDFDDSCWQEASVCADADIPMVLRAGNLLARPIPFMEQSHHVFKLPFHTVHTPRGDLNVAWEKGAGGIQVQISGDADAISRIMAN